MKAGQTRNCADQRLMLLLLHLRFCRCRCCCQHDDVRFTADVSPTPLNPLLPPDACMLLTSRLCSLLPQAFEKELKCHICFEYMEDVACPSFCQRPLPPTSRTCATPTALQEGALLPALLLFLKPLTCLPFTPHSQRKCTKRETGRAATGD